MSFHSWPIRGLPPSLKAVSSGAYLIWLDDRAPEKPKSILNMTQVGVIRMKLIEAENDTIAIGTNWISFDPIELSIALWWGIRENPILAFNMLIESAWLIEEDFKKIDFWNWDREFFVSSQGWNTWVNKVILFLTRVINGKVTPLYIAENVQNSVSDAIMS